MKYIYLIAIAIALSQTSEAQRKPMDADERELSKYITNYSKLYKLEREVFSCVLFVESSYRMNVISDTDDYGIGQINLKTIRGYNFDRLRLLTDVGYSVRAAAEVLSDFRRYFKQQEVNDWPGRYNIGYQNLTTNNIGAAYVQYNSKVRNCINSNQYL